MEGVAEATRNLVQRLSEGAESKALFIAFFTENLLVH
jgi:hypothetical protein